MNVAGWRAWYTNGRVYESTLTKWENLSTEGVLFVMLYLGKKTVGGVRYREALYGCDYYWRENVDVFRNEDVAPKGVSAKAGAMIPDEEFDQIVADAFASVWP